MKMYKLYQIKLPLVSISNLNKFPKVFIQGKQEKQSGKILQYVHLKHYNQYNILFFVIDVCQLARDDI